MTLPDTFFYPNQMGRIILLSMEEVMGRNGVHAVLKLASLLNLVDNYPPDNREREFSFSTVYISTRLQVESITHSSIGR